MIYCRKCGYQMPDDSEFCPECGTPVARTKKDKPASQNPAPETGFGTRLNTENMYGRFDLEKLPKGHIIDERYEIIRKLGQGSFGAVYLAYDNHMEIQKALKIIPEAVTNDKEAMISLKKEASIMVKLNHPNIVRVYDFHYSSDVKYIDMEYVNGISLADLKLEKKDKKFPEAEVKNYAIQIAEGLEYAHNQRVIHKDIKPQNIMLTQNGTIKLMDFGIAETVHNSMSRLKNTGSSGTLVYMSPEQLRGKDVGKESDIYAVGATLYELLTGNPPFFQGDVTYQIISENPQPIMGISEQLNEVVMKCLEKERGQRFSNCYELRLAIKKPPIPKRKEIIKESENKNQDKKPVPSKIVSGQKNKKKGGTTKIAGIAIVAIIILVAGFFIHRYVVKENKIKALVKQANTAINKEQITSPQGDNAWYYLTELRVIDPKNKSIAGIKNKIIGYYEQKGDEAFNKKDYSEALDYYQKGNRFAPDYTRFQEQINLIKQFSHFSGALKKKLSYLGYKPEKVMLFENFSSDTTPFFLGSGEDQEESIGSDGRYHLKDKTENSSFSPGVTVIHHNIILSCSVKGESSPNNNYFGGGIFIENQAGTEYCLGISGIGADKKYFIGSQQGSKAWNDRVDWTTNHVIVSDASNQLELLVVGKTIFYFINGHFIKWFTYKNELSGDQIGFFIGGTGEYSFDNLRVLSIGK